MYFIRIENTRTERHEALIVYGPIEVGTVIGWGADERNADGVAYWRVQSCEPYEA